MRFTLANAADTAWQVCVWDVINDACLATEQIIQSRSGTEGAPNAQIGGASVDAGNDYGVAIAPGANIPGSVTFNSFGRASMPGTDLRRIDVRNTLISAADERRLVILVSLGGQVRLCDPKHNRATNGQGC